MDDNTTPGRASADDTGQRALAIIVAEKATNEERRALQVWASQLLAIRDSNRTRLGKTKAALALTASAKVVWPAVRIMASAVKAHGWDNRGASARWGIAGAGVGLALFGTQGAGIAALGTAVGVPLWVVLGAGSMFAKALHEELTKRQGDG